jgi:hypothetical protein
MNITTHEKGKTQGKGMIHLASEGHCLLNLVEALIRITQDPEKPSQVGKGEGAQVVSVYECQIPVLRGIIGGDDLLQVDPSLLPLSQVK